jgi:O-antigen/teichoic acid export membrane protein
MAWYAYSSADFATVGRVVGLAALGYYQFAWNIAQLPGEKLANVLQGVVGPFFGAIGDDRAALRHYFLVLSELLLSVMWPILFGFALVSPLAVPLVFGAKWAAAVPVLQILVICAASSSLSLMSQHVLSATGHASDTLKLNLVAVLVLPLAFYGAARYSGILAVACVWLVAQPTLTGIPLLRMRPAIDLTIREFLFAMRAPIVSALLMTSVLLALRPFIAGLVPIVQLLLLCALGALVYVTAFLLLFGERVSAIRELWRDRP